MNGYPTLSAFRADVDWLEQNVYRHAMDKIDRIDPVQDSGTHWQKLGVAMRALPNSMVKQGLFIAFDRLFKARPADVQTGIKILADIKGTLEALMACLALYGKDQLPGDAEESGVKVTVDWFIEHDVRKDEGGRIGDGRIVEIEKEFFGARSLYPWQRARLTVESSRRDTLCRMATVCGLPVGHYVAEIRKKTLLITDFASLEGNRVSPDLPEHLVMDLLRMLHPFQSAAGDHYARLEQAVLANHPAAFSTTAYTGGARKEFL